MLGTRYYNDDVFTIWSLLKIAGVIWNQCLIFLYWDSTVSVLYNGYEGDIPLKELVMNYIKERAKDVERGDSQLDFRGEFVEKRLS